MTNAEIRLGQCWMARLSKRDLCVRLESRTPDGGWIARSMSHGRKVKIKSECVLLCRCDKAKTVAETTRPNRRSHATPPSREPTTRKLMSKAHKVVEKPVREQLVPLSLLDAAALVLRKSKTALSTREIIALVIERKLWEPTGVTPWATLNAALNRDLQVNGTQSQFQKKTAANMRYADIENTLRPLRKRLHQGSDNLIHFPFSNTPMKPIYFCLCGKFGWVVPQNAVKFRCRI